MTQQLQPWHVFSAVFVVFWAMMSYFDNFLVTLVLCVGAGFATDNLNKFMKVPGGAAVALEAKEGKDSEQEPICPDKPLPPEPPATSSEDEDEPEEPQEVSEAVVEVVEEPVDMSNGNFMMSPPQSESKEPEVSEKPEVPEPQIMVQKPQEVYEELIVSMVATQMHCAEDPQGVQELEETVEEPEEASEEPEEPRISDDEIEPLEQPREDSEEENSEPPEPQEEPQKEVFEPLEPSQLQEDDIAHSFEEPQKEIYEPLDPQQPQDVKEKDDLEPQDNLVDTTSSPELLDVSEVIEASHSINQPSEVSFDPFEAKSADNLEVTQPSKENSPSPNLMGAVEVKDSNVMMDSSQSSLLDLGSASEPQPTQQILDHVTKTSLEEHEEELANLLKEAQKEDENEEELTAILNRDNDEGDPWVIDSNPSSIRGSGGESLVHLDSEELANKDDISHCAVFGDEVEPGDLDLEEEMPKEAYQKKASISSNSSSSSSSADGPDVEESKDTAGEECEGQQKARSKSSSSSSSSSESADEKEEANGNSKDAAEALTGAILNLAQAGNCKFIALKTR